MNKKHKVNAITPRLSDEDPDPIEQDDFPESNGLLLLDGWHPWDEEDINDVKRLIEHRMEPKQKSVFVAFLSGQSYNDLGVTEKYWRYHFTKGIEFIKQELKI